MSTTVTTEQIRAAQAGDQAAMWEIVTAYEPIMGRIIRGVAPGATRDQRDDLIQEARAVLLQHIHSYDSDSSAASLATYAYTAIRRAVAEEWLGASTTVSVDRSAALRVRRALWDTEGDVEGAWMIVSSDVDPRRRMSREAFVSVCEALADATSFDAPVDVRHGSGIDGHVTLADTIPDTSADFTSVTERRDLARWLMTQIPQRQSLALRAFYGVGMMQQPEAETAAEMGTTRKNLEVLRSRGKKTARIVADAHAISA
ncbi:sigma-70 family RNA polymerase sigma factor [Streptomyces sp. NPDC002561]|uniref:sigma-70 family RNA polymerase sigma factor n=1 Tax=Streptomyces sp. NPDC002561 TaxID=3154418 RepID=UPI00332C0201